MEKEKAKEKLKTKKTVPATTNKPKANLKDYIKGVRIETKKVIWPTRKELGSYTGVVLMACCAFALVFWAFDSAFLAALKYVLNISF